MQEVQGTLVDYADHYLEKALDAAAEISSDSRNLPSYGVLRSYFNAVNRFFSQEDSNVTSLLQSVRGHPEEIRARVPQILPHFQQFSRKMEIFSSGIESRLNTCADLASFVSYNGTFDMIQTEGKALNILEKMHCNVQEALTLMEHVNLLLQFGFNETRAIDPATFSGSVTLDSNRELNNTLTTKVYDLIESAYNETASSFELIRELSCRPEMISSDLINLVPHLKTAQNFTQVILNNIPWAHSILEKINKHVLCHEFYSNITDKYPNGLEHCPAHSCGDLVVDFSSYLQTSLSSNNAIIMHLELAIRQLDTVFSIGKNLIFLEDEMNWLSWRPSCTELPSSFSLQRLEFSPNVSQHHDSLVGMIKDDTGTAFEALNASSLHWENLQGLSSPENYRTTKSIVQKAMSTMLAVSCVVKTASLELKITQPGVEEAISQVDSLFIATDKFLERIETLVNTYGGLGESSQSLGGDIFTLEARVMTDLRKFETFQKMIFDSMERIVTLWRNNVEQ